MNGLKDGMKKVTGRMNREMRTIPEATSELKD